MLHFNATAALGFSLKKNISQLFENWRCVSRKARNAVGPAPDLSTVDRVRLLYHRTMRGNK